MSELERAARQVVELSTRVEQDSEEYLGEDGMVIVVPIDTYNDMIESITALREALAEQAEQEPVGMLRMGAKQDFVTTKAAEELSSGHDEWHPVYAAPVRTKDLTDDEIFEILELQNCPKSELKYWFHDARAIIAADREKNK